MSFEKVGNYVVNSVKDLIEIKRQRSDVMDDTIHYLSPASVRSLADNNADQFVGETPPRSEHEHLHEPWSARSSRLLQPAPPIVASPQRTLLLIKPFAVKYEQVVERKLRQQGYRILQRRRLQLSAEQLCDFYLDPCDELSFPYSVLSSSNAPIVVLCVAAVDAVNRLKKLVGKGGTIHYSWFWPRTISTKFGYVESVHDALHASDTLHAANRDIRFFFPKMILEPLLQTENQVADFLWQTVNRTLLHGLTEVCKKKPIEPILFLAEWLMLNNPYYPKVDPTIAKLPN